MSRALRVAGLVLRVLPIVLVLLVAVPGSGVRPTTLTLTKVEKVEAYDVGRDVVWVLVLGADQQRDTDAFQLLGIDARTGAAAGIGIPRDSYVDLHGDLGMGRINAAYKQGGPELAAQVVDDLVGIEPDYVLVTEAGGFVAMVDALGGVTVDSPLAFTTEDGGMSVEKGPNDFDGAQAFDFAGTRIFSEAPGPGDFIRSVNHQALLLGLLKTLQENDDREGFVETMARVALDGIETADASPLELYKLLNLLTSVDPDKVEGCIVTGEEATVGTAQIIIPDDDLAKRLGREAEDDATFESRC